MNKNDKNVAAVERESYTLINKKEKNKIGKRDICTNASNCGVQFKNETDNKTGRQRRRPLQIPTQKNANVKECYTNECCTEILNNNTIFAKNKLNTVGADASVRPQKEHNQNKYKIKIFNKIKSDIVGVGVPDDPLKKKKHTNKLMSNNQTSNIKHPTSNSAITLIALIITIIVLLILAGVTLSMVMGDSGLFSKANNASEQTKISNVKEIIRMQVLENELNKKTKDSNAKSDEALQAAVETKLTEEGYKVEEGKITIGSTEINIAEEIANASSGENGGSGGTTAGKEDASKNRTLAGTTTGYSYKNPVIPQGFKAVDEGSATWTYTDETQTEVAGWNEGLVIKDTIGNEFVWVPVDGTKVEYKKWCTIGKSYSECSDDTSAIPVTENTQINTYHGFYVARYEAGLTTETLEQNAEINNNTNTTAVSKPGTKIWNNIDYNNANTVAKAMVNNTATYGNNKSGLVTGKQWDTIMKWYQNENIKVDTTQDWGTYYNLPYTIQGSTEKPALWFNSDSNSSTWSSSAQNVSHSANNGKYYHASGFNQDGIKKNIADIGGNVWEWTAEIYSGNRVTRGGGVYNSATDCPASYRDYNSTGYTHYFLGFRAVLYVQ